MGKLIDIKSDKNVQAYLATPKGDPKAGVIVIHEVWGLDEHIKSIADRCASEGYIALAPSLLEKPSFSSNKLKQIQYALFDPEKRNSVQPELRKLMAPMQEPDFGEITTKRLKACFDYLYEKPDTKQKVAVSGFCFGGTYSFSLAVVEPRLILALPFYGHSDHSAEELKKINCPLRAFYGQNDERLISSLPDLTKRMEKAGIDFTSKVYPNCGHAFFNDTNPNAYNQEAAKDAWQLVLKELDSVT